MLLSYVKKKGFKPIGEVSIITNGLVWELLKVKNENSDVTFTAFYEWIVDLYGEKWPQPDPPTYQALSKSVVRLNAKLEKLKKMHSSTEKEKLLSEFFAEDYIFPKLGYHKETVIAFSPQRPMIQKSDSAGNSIKEMKQKICDIKRNANKRIKHRDAVIQ